MYGFSSCMFFLVLRLSGFHVMQSLYGTSASLDPAGPAIPGNATGLIWGTAYDVDCGK